MERHDTPTSEHVSHVPVHPADRKKFLEKIKNNNRSIPQGEFREAKRRSADKNRSKSISMEK